MASYILLYPLTPDNWPADFPRSEGAFQWPHILPANPDEEPVVLDDAQLDGIFAATPRDLTREERIQRLLDLGILVPADAKKKEIAAAIAKAQEFDKKAAVVQKTQLETKRTQE